MPIISIHVSLWETTDMRRKLWYNKNYFNPRLSVRDDVFEGLYPSRLIKFQSTSLCERRLILCEWVADAENFNPRLSVRDDRYYPEDNIRAGISIHVSLWETTASGGGVKNRVIDFNPRLSVRDDFAVVLHVVGDVYFNPRLSVRDDRLNPQEQFLSLYFNPRLSVRDDGIYTNGWQQKWYFNPRLSVRDDWMC